MSIVQKVMKYFKIYDFMLNELKLKGNALLVYAYLYMWHESKKPLFLEYQQIAELLCIDKAAFTKIIKKLKSKGLIISMEKGKVVKMTTHSCQNDNCASCQNDNSQLSKRQLTVVKMTTHSCQNDNSTINKNIKETLKENNKGVTPTAEIISISELVLIKWNEHYERHFNTGYVPDYRSLTNDRDLISDAVKNKMQELKKNPDNADEASEFIQAMFEAMFSIADKWQKGHWTLHTVATQFNQLYNAIINRKNGNSKNNGGITDEYIARKMREAGLL